MVQDDGTVWPNWCMVPAGAWPKVACGDACATGAGSCKPGEECGSHEPMTDAERQDKENMFRGVLEKEPENIEIICALAEFICLGGAR